MKESKGSRDSKDSKDVKSEVVGVKRRRADDERVQCECGAFVARRGLPEHKETKTHKRSVYASSVATQTASGSASSSITMTDIASLLADLSSDHVHLSDGDVADAGSDKDSNDIFDDGFSVQEELAELQREQEEEELQYEI